ncbi:MAG: hypothetical protein RLZ54_792 [Candidatus Parcubacteria bacterium]|jgi:Ni,Fe-hydrogenase I large subunit
MATILMQQYYILKQYDYSNVTRMEVNQKDDPEIDKLESQISSFHHNSDSLENALKEYVANNRKTDFKKDPHFQHDFFLSSIRQLIFSYRYFNNINFDRNEPESHSDAGDKKTAILISFFINAKLILEVIKKHSKKFNFNTEEKELYKATKKIRDYLAHSDEKNISDNRKDKDNKIVIAKYDPNFHIHEMEILNLYGLDMETMGDLYFSIHIIYRDLEKLIVKYFKSR